MNQSGLLVPKAIYHTAQVQQVQFSTLNAEEIELASVLEVTQPRLYEAGQPTKGGVNDLRMGIIKPGQKCLTCGQSKECQGHFGHIKLAEPVFHVGYLPFVQKVLKCVCHNCGKLKYFATDQQKDKLKEILKLPSASKRLHELVGLLNPINRCPHSTEDGVPLGCGSAIPTKISIKEKMRLFVVEKQQKNNSQTEYSALRVKGIFEKISQGDRKMLGFTISKPVDLLISILAVAPPQVRPSVELGPEKRAQDDITNAYCRIVALNNQIKQGLGTYHRMMNLREIQKLIASIMVKLDKKYLPPLKEKAIRRKNAARKIKSIEERLVAKEGRFRQHLMGKRVDFSARSVISPDPFLDLDEVGVPKRIAKNLTIPEEINEFNFERIVKLCQSGSVKYLLQPQVGSRTPNFIYLNNLKTAEEIKKYVAFGTVAERELEDGDYVLFNRQPTLHRMSMMGHRVRILPLNTFRLNLSVCSPYNADFDGDEMNMHVPQSVEAAAELKHIALVPNQVISPKNSTPVMGIVQDSLLGIYLLTNRQTFLTREEVMNLVIWIDPNTKYRPENLPMPCILKPKPLWSGKQLISYILPEKLSMRVLRDERSKKNIDDKSGLLIKSGELLSGALLKEHVGPGSGMVVHAIWIEIGPEGTSDFISYAQRIVTSWMMNNSFSVGAADVMIDHELEIVRCAQVDKIKQNYFKNLHMFRNLPLYINENLHQKGKKVADSLEYKINLDLNNSLSRMQRILSERVSVQENSIYKMITARSKGSETNLVQIMFCLGNQNVDGRRCPLGFSRRALPHFSKDDNSPEPRGFVFSSFFKGLKPHQFFFHSMAGREGLSDTAVKTSSIGYIQRKLVKALEDLSIQYDGTVRDSQGNMLQKCYGEDGFQPEFIERHKFNDAKLSEHQFVKKYGWDIKSLAEYGYEPAKLQRINQQLEQLLKARRMLRERLIKQGDNQDMEYHCPINLYRLVIRAKDVKKNSGKLIDPFSVIEITSRLCQECILPQFKKNYCNVMKKVDVMRERGEISYQQYWSAKQAALSEAGMMMFHSHIKLWFSSKKVCLEYRLTVEQMEAIFPVIVNKFRQAISPSGEAIGSLAAQSIGEPTTQMTLNTFHLAGVSDKNVTLGIPRLRELLDVSKNIKTPFMTIYYYRRLLWEERNTEEMGHIQNLMLSMLPERHIRDCLESSKIYFDAGQELSNIDDTEQDETLRARRSHWVLDLKFQTEKITSAPIWRGILQALREQYGKDYDVVQKVGIGDEMSPEVQLILTKELESKIGSQNAFKHISQREVELKDIFLSGMKGIKSIKTARKISYQYGSEDEMNLSLETRRDDLAFDAVGSNLRECLSNGYVNPVKTTSNDLYEVYQVLGIEAARQCFLNQIKQVLKPYSIYINHRHLLVLADWMACRGTLTPVNRHGINRVRDVSVLRKASFEQTVDMLYTAAAFSETDDLKGVSERLIFGEKLNLGTNSCEVYVDPSMVANYAYQPMTFSSKEEYEEDIRYFEEHGMATPKGLETPNLSFFSESSPISSQAGSFSRSPNYSHSSIQVEPNQIMNSSSPRYSHLGQEEKSITIGERRNIKYTVSPTYSYNVKDSNSGREKITMMQEFSSRSPSYEFGEPAVRPTATEEFLKDEESNSSDEED